MATTIIALGEGRVHDILPGGQRTANEHSEHWDWRGTEEVDEEGGEERD